MLLLLVLLLVLLVLVLVLMLLLLLLLPPPLQHSPINMRYLKQLGGLHRCVYNLLLLRRALSIENLLQQLLLLLQLLL